MSAARDILARVRTAGLPDALVEQLERDLVPPLEAFLEAAPLDPPPRGPAEDALHRAFLACMAPVGGLLHAGSSMLDALAAVVEQDLLRDALDGAAKHRALSHLADGLDSLTRMAAATTTALRKFPELATSFEPGDAVDLDEDDRRFLRGVVALVVALSRASATAERLAPWTWVARQALLASEGVVLLRLAQLEPPKVATPQPRREPGAWKGIVHIAPDFDDPLPADMLALFYGEDPHG